MDASEAGPRVDFGPPPGLRGGKGGSHPGSVLDEKYFRRVDKLAEAGGYRAWLFDLTIAQSQVDTELGEQVKRIIKEEGGLMSPEKWDPVLDGGGP